MDVSAPRAWPRVRVRVVPRSPLAAQIAVRMTGVVVVVASASVNGAVLDARRSAGASRGMCGRTHSPSRRVVNSLTKFSTGGGSRRVRRRSSGDGEHGVGDDAVDRAVETFWRLWTGAAHCRAIVTASERGSLWRDAARIEATVRRALTAFPPGCGLDVPTIMTREPRLLELDVRVLVSAVVRVKSILGLDGRQVGLAPGLVLCVLLDAERVEKRLREIVEELGAEEARRRINEQPDLVLAALDYWQMDDSGEGDVKRHYSRAVPPTSDRNAVNERVADRERGARKFHVDSQSV